MSNMDADLGLGSRRMLAQFPLLVADIGGTNARFGWVEDASAELTDVQSLYCADYATPTAAIEHYLDRFQKGRPAVHASIAIAGAIGAGPIKVTNSHWILDPGTFATSIRSQSLQVFNDFEAIALALPHLDAHDYRLVGSVKPDPALAMGVIGPGTGLGVAGLIPVRGMPGMWQTVCGEGGHVTLAAVNDYQSEILRAVRLDNLHVSAERLISGIGLPALRKAVAAVERITIDEELSAEEIGQRGTMRDDRLSEQTVEVFCEFLGSIAGNLALTIGARGGVFIAGGIVPKLADFFVQSGFREHFEAKGRYRDYLQNISTPVVTAPYPGLTGLVHQARHQVRR